MSFCITLPNFVQIEAAAAEILRHIHILRWRPRRLNTTSGFVYVDVTAFSRSKSISKPNFVKISQMAAEYRVKVSDTKVTHFTPILALCTCLYRSHLGQQNTAESQRLKIYVQNVHHSREHMHSNDYATAQSLMVLVAVSSLGAMQLHFLEPGVSMVTITIIQFC